MDEIKVLINKADIEKRVTELAEEIKKEYQGKHLTLVCVLKGAVLFLSDLCRKLDTNIEMDFMDISSYGDGTESSGTIKINKDLENPITGKDVLLVEDIIDSGRTLVHIVDHLMTKRPSSLKICTFLDKPARRVDDSIKPSFVGYEVPDVFIVGYGLDYAQKYRNLDFIGYITQD